MLSCEGTGKTIEKAIEDALFSLRAPREDVDIKILEEGGLFKKAKVLVSISEDAKAKYETKKEEVRAEDLEDIDIKKLFSQKEEVKVENDTKAEVKNEEPANLTFEPMTASDNKSIDFLLNIFNKMDILARVDEKEEDEKLIYTITSNKSAEIIGFRGELLNALQYLTNVVEGKSGSESKHIVLDIQNYRAKREETLISLAHRMARKVAKTHHQIKLEPMTANERRIIHAALSEDTFVTTFSKGTEPNRFLVIAPIGTKNED